MQFERLLVCVCNDFETIIDEFSRHWCMLLYMLPIARRKEGALINPSPHYFHAILDYGHYDDVIYTKKVILLYFH